MSLIRNPWFVGLIAIVAIGLAWRNLFPGPEPAQVVMTETLVSEVKPHSKTAFPKAPADRLFLRSHVTEWIDSPRRDPFQVEKPNPVAPAHAH
jgi:hypothetical protein